MVPTRPARVGLSRNQAPPDRTPSQTHHHFDRPRRACAPRGRRQTPPDGPSEALRAPRGPETASQLPHPHDRSPIRCGLLPSESEITRHGSTQATRDRTRPITSRSAVRFSLAPIETPNAEEPQKRLGGRRRLPHPLRAAEHGSAPVPRQPNRVRSARARRLRWASGPRGVLRLDGRPKNTPLRSRPAGRRDRPRPRHRRAPSRAAPSSSATRSRGSTPWWSGAGSTTAHTSGSCRRTNSRTRRGTWTGTSVSIQSSSRTTTAASTGWTAARPSRTGTTIRSAARCARRVATPILAVRADEHVLRLEEALRAEQGNRAAAARRLGVSKQWLHRLLSRWGRDTFEPAARSVG